MPTYEVDVNDLIYEVELPEDAPVAPSPSPTSPDQLLRAAGSAGAQPFVNMAQGMMSPPDPLDPLHVKEQLINVPNPELTYGAAGAMAGAAIPVPFASLGLNAAGSAFGKAIEESKGQASLTPKAIKNIVWSAVRNAGIQAGAMGVGKVASFLRGNTKQIEQAGQVLDRKAHEAVLSVRRGGRFQDQVFDTLKAESEKAWAPMKQVAGAIQQPVAMEELKAVMSQRLANDPERLNAALMVLDDLVETTPSLTATELTDLSLTIGKTMRKAALRGDVARSFTELVASDLRSGIADLLDFKAPLPLKGAVFQAKTQWSNYAADRDAFFRYFKPGGSANQPTASGVNALKRTALGKAGAYEQDFFTRAADASGIDLPSTIRQYAVAVQRAEQVGEAGRETAKFLKYIGVPTATLAYLLGRSKQ